jgi:CubicO group peptidase (beta-lactamase class C family)
MASVSKMYTAAAVARLVQEKKLDLDTPVVRYLPELPGHYAGITTRHLVSHQAGIRHYYGADTPEKTGHYADVSDALTFSLGAPLLFPPGTDWAYSTYGWVLLSAVVERVSGKPFLRYMQEDVWAPLGLVNTFAEIPADRKKDLSTFYVKDRPQGKLVRSPRGRPEFQMGGWWLYLQCKRPRPVWRGVAGRKVPLRGDPAPGVHPANHDPGGYDRFWHWHNGLHNG